MDSLLNSISADQRKDLPEFGAGDTLRIHQRVIEGEKERIQIFEGVCVQKKSKGMSATFTVRKIATGGIGVERIYPGTSTLRRQAPPTSTPSSRTPSSTPTATRPTSTPR